MHVLHSSHLSKLVLYDHSREEQYLSSNMSFWYELKRTMP